MDPLWHCDIVGEVEAGCFDVLWFVTCILTVMVCLFFLRMPLVGYFFVNVAISGHLLYFYSKILWAASREKSAFKHAQNEHIQIIMSMRKVSSGPFVFIHTITKTCLFKYIENIPTKHCTISDKNIWHFFFFFILSKNRLLVLVRTASARRF